MRLIVMKEFTKKMSFTDTVLFLRLEEDVMDEFIGLCMEENSIRADEDARIARAIKRQNAMIDSGNLTGISDKLCAIFDQELYDENGDIPRASATFLVGQKDIDTAKEFLMNFQSEEDFPEVMEENFDEADEADEVDEAGEADEIPTNATILHGIIKRLDNYHGVNFSFEELNFGEDFFQYFREDVLIEEAQEGDNDEAPMDAADEEGSLPEDVGGHVPSAPITKAKPTNKKSTKVDKNAITVNLIPKQKKTRRPKSAVKPPPSRLREVQNAEDLESEEPSSPTNRESSPATTLDPSSPIEDSMQSSRPVTPTSRRSLGRDPFQEYSSPNGPPPHSALFPVGLPAQPAPTSPPKASSVSLPSRASTTDLNPPLSVSHLEVDHSALANTPYDFASISTSHDLSSISKADLKHMAQPDSSPPKLSSASFLTSSSGGSSATTVQSPSKLPQTEHPAPPNTPRTSSTTSAVNAPHTPKTPKLKITHKNSILGSPRSAELESLVAKQNNLSKTGELHGPAIGVFQSHPASTTHPSGLNVELGSFNDTAMSNITSPKRPHDDLPVLNLAEHEQPLAKKPRLEQPRSHVVAEEQQSPKRPRDEQSLPSTHKKNYPPRDLALSSQMYLQTLL